MNEPIRSRRPPRIAITDEVGAVHLPYIAVAAVDVLEQDAEFQRL
jgi:hypothetical protein